MNRFCGSSMQAIHMAAGAIQMDAGEAFICAGVESMTRVAIGGFNPMLHPGLAERYPQAYISMGETAENLAAHPDRQQMKAALAGNLCRCTGYIKILEAIELAAQRLATA